MMKVLLISPLPITKSKYTWQYSLDLSKLCTNINYDIISDQGIYKNDGLDENEYLNFRKTNFFTIPFQLLKLIKKYDYQAVHFQYEHKIFGSIHKTYLILLFSSFIRLFGKKFVITIHNTPKRVDIFNFTYLWNNKGKHNSSMLKTNIIWFFYLLATKIIVFISSKIIVHEEFQKHVLEENYKIKNSKTYVVPHHLYDTDMDQEIYMNNDTQRSVLTLLFFGYQAPYKGLDDLIDTFANEKNKNMRLLICGDKPKYLNQSTQSKIDSWHKSQINKTKGIENIKWIPAIKNDKIPELFEMSDYVVMPYKSVFGSSGVLSWSLKFRKRIILSNHFEKTNLSAIPTIKNGIKYAINQWDLNHKSYKSIIDIEINQRRSSLIEEKLLSIYE